MCVCVSACQKTRALCPACSVHMRALVCICLPEGPRIRVQNAQCVRVRAHVRPPEGRASVPSMRPHAPLMQIRWTASGLVHA
eukprot:1358126-Alexandrium_andersonii.AAC.1